MFGWAASKPLMTLYQAARSPTSNCSPDIRLSVTLPFLLLLGLLLPQADRTEAPTPAAARPPLSWKKLRRLSGFGSGAAFASLRALPFISFLCPLWAAAGSPEGKQGLNRNFA